MHHLLSSLLFIAAVVLTATTAAPTKLQGRSFKVHRQRQPNHVRNGPAALQKAYRKYGWSMPDALNASTTSQKDSDPSSSSSSSSAPSPPTTNQETGDTTATPEQNDQEFLAPISVGGQTLLLDFDTGSSDLWLFSTLLPQSQQSSHTLYDPSKSSSYSQLQDSTWRIQYGDSSGASGIVGTDTVNIGGATVTSQAVELATSASAAFIADTNSNGLVGLAFSSLNTVQPQPQKTFFDNIQDDLAAPLFTANLKHASAGAYEFGLIDTSQFQGAIQYAPVDSSHGFWQFSSTSFAVGGGPVQQNGQASPAIADTGTSLVLVDDVVARGYWTQVAGARVDGGQGGWVFPCEAQLPDLKLDFGGNVGVVGGGLMNFAQVADGTCFGGLQSNNGQGIQIFGDVMFKALFVVFDGGNSRLGIAPHA